MKSYPFRRRAMQEERIKEVGERMKTANNNEKKTMERNESGREIVKGKGAREKIEKGEGKMG